MSVDRGLIKAYEEGKKAGKDKDSRVNDNPYKKMRNKDIPTPLEYEKAWREGWEDGAYPSDKRKGNPYLKESKFELYLESCEEKDEAFTKSELAKKLNIDPSKIKTNSVKGKMDLWIVDGKTYKKK
jgi:hypothetical protein